MPYNLGDLLASLNEGQARREDAAAQARWDADFRQVCHDAISFNRFYVSQAFQHAIVLNHVEGLKNELRRYLGSLAPASLTDPSVYATASQAQASLSRLARPNTYVSGRQMEAEFERFRSQHWSRTGDGRHPGMPLIPDDLPQNLGDALAEVQDLRRKLAEADARADHLAEVAAVDRQAAADALAQANEKWAMATRDVQRLSIQSEAYRNALLELNPKGLRDRQVVASNAFLTYRRELAKARVVRFNMAVGAAEDAAQWYARTHVDAPENCTVLNWAGLERAETLRRELCYRQHQAHYFLTSELSRPYVDGGYIEHGSPYPQLQARLKAALDDGARDYPGHQTPLLEDGRPPLAPDRAVPPHLTLVPDESRFPEADPRDCNDAPHDGALALVIEPHEVPGVESDGPTPPDAPSDPSCQMAEASEPEGSRS